MAETDQCSLCETGPENCEHIFRQCRQAKQFWSSRQFPQVWNGGSALLPVFGVYGGSGVSLYLDGTGCIGGLIRNHSGAWCIGFQQIISCKTILEAEEDEVAKKYVGIPAMNSICKALCHEPGVEARFGITVGRMDWLQDRSSWSLSGLNGQDLGHFDGVVASDKNISSPRFASLTGRSPPLDLSLHQELAGKWQDIPVRSCFVLMLAFSEPLSSIPLRGFSFKNSNILSRAFCDSSKPGRSHVSTNNSEKWVLHSTPEYAAGVITRTGLQKLSSDTLAMVADELLHEFQTTKLKIPHPFYMKAHRWGSAFPATNIGGEEKCLWDKDKNLVICGDFCASPSVEGAVLSGIRAASKILEI